MRTQRQTYWVRFSLEGALDWDMALSLLAREGWVVDVRNARYRVEVSLDEEPEFFWALDQVKLALRDHVAQGEEWDGVEWVSGLVAPASRAIDSELLEWLVGQDEVGLWVHVVNREPKSWANYLAELIQLDGEIACSRLGEDLYKTAGDDARWAVLFYGPASYVWAADMASCTDIWGTRYATAAVHTKRSEAWVSPRSCAFKGVVRV